MLKFRVDYFQGVTNFRDVSDLSNYLEFLASSVSSTFSLDEKSFFCGRKFLYSFSSPYGFKGGYNYLDNGSIECLLLVSGSYFSRLSDTRDIFNSLASKYACTRLDIAIDDYSRSVPFSLVRRACVDNLYKHFDIYRYLESGCDSHIAPTIYFGSTSSDKMVRFYDAEFVHQIPADRWELQLRRDWAVAACKLGLENFDSLPGLLSACLDFRNDHGKRLSWWRKIVNKLPHTEPSLPVYKPSIDKAVNWLFTQAAPTFAVLAHGLPADVFESLIKRLVLDGDSRLKNHHYSWIETIKKEVANNGEEVLSFRS